MKAITQFLNTNVGFHYEDLSLIRRVELKEIKKELNVSNEWILLALSKDKLENWEEWGFGLFRKKEFKDTITASLEALLKIPEEEIRKEIQKNKKTKNGRPVFHYDYELVKERYEQVKKQGKVLTDYEASQQGYKRFVGYNACIKPEGKIDLDNLIASGKPLSEYTENDEILLLLGSVWVRWWKQ